MPPLSVLCVAGPAQRKVRSVAPPAASPAGQGSGTAVVLVPRCRFSAQAWPGEPGPSAPPVRAEAGRARAPGRLRRSATGAWPGERGPGVASPFRVTLGYSVRIPLRYHRWPAARGGGGLARGSGIITIEAGARGTGRRGGGSSAATAIAFYKEAPQSMYDDDYVDEFQRRTSQCTRSRRVARNGLAGRHRALPHSTCAPPGTDARYLEDLFTAPGGSARPRERVRRPDRCGTGDGRPSRGAAACNYSGTRANATAARSTSKVADAAGLHHVHDRLRARRRRHAWRRRASRRHPDRSARDGSREFDNSKKRAAPGHGDGA